MKEIDGFVRECIQNSKENGEDSSKFSSKEFAIELIAYTDTEYTEKQLIESIERVRRFVRT